MRTKCRERYSIVRFDLLRMIQEIDDDPSLLQLFYMRVYILIANWAKMEIISMTAKTVGPTVSS